MIFPKTNRKPEWGHGFAVPLFCRTIAGGNRHRAAIVIINHCSGYHVRAVKINRTAAARPRKLGRTNLMRGRKRRIHIPGAGRSALRPRRVNWQRNANLRRPPWGCGPRPRRAQGGGALRPSPARPRRRAVPAVSANTRAGTSLGGALVSLGSAGAPARKGATRVIAAAAQRSRVCFCHRGRRVRPSPSSPRRPFRIATGMAAAVSLRSAAAYAGRLRSSRCLGKSPRPRPLRWLRARRRLAGLALARQASRLRGAGPRQPMPNWGASAARRRQWARFAR